MHAIDLPNLKSCMEEPSSNYLVKELKEARALISRLNMEKEGFMHDLADAKIAKLASDTLVAQQGVRLGEAEKDLNFYQVQLSKCVSERDHALFEADEIRSLLVKAESGYKEERARAESEAVARASLNQQLSSLREQIKKHELEIESLSKECENSGRKMRQAAEEKRRLESASKDLRVMRIV